ncbi:uncharacterized protein LOC104416014 isoform X2 [Eucalyptus grandis]|nr:uncharacterized protein LOC104416014 isoform X2 [Eucalyptus grandis]
MPRFISQPITCSDSLVAGPHQILVHVYDARYHAEVNSVNARFQMLRKSWTPKLHPKSLLPSPAHLDFRRFHVSSYNYVSSFNIFALFFFFVVLERLETSVAFAALPKESWRVCSTANAMGCGAFVVEQGGGEGVCGILRRPRAAGAWLGSELRHACAAGGGRPRVVRAVEVRKVIRTCEEPVVVHSGLLHPFLHRHSRNDFQGQPEAQYSLLKDNLESSSTLEADMFMPGIITLRGISLVCI